MKETFRVKKRAKIFWKTKRVKQKKKERLKEIAKERQNVNRQNEINK